MYRIGKTLITEEEIKKMLTEVSDKINKDYAGCDEIFLIGVLRGALVFLADLMRLIKIPVIMDFLVVSSYGSDTESSGVVMLVKDVDADLEGKHVIIVEDLIDTGVTLRYLRNMLNTRNPASLKICTAFDKPARRKVDLTPDYVGMAIPDKFIVGYGLDVANRYRNLPEVYILEEN